jgi:hypothetical protein
LIWHTPREYQYQSLASDLLSHDLKISPITINMAHTRRHNCLVQFPFTDFPDPFVGLSNATVAALLRSEADLSEALKSRHFDETFKEKDMYVLYSLITRMGWVRGGQILLDAGLSYGSEVGRTPPLLDTARLRESSYGAILA